MRRRRPIPFARAVPWVVGAFLLLPGSSPAQNCVGCTPLDDAAGPLYLGTYPLGLYPGATNAPPASHLALALQAAASVVPRDATGAADPEGFIGFLSIGMSNTNQEFAVFERVEDANLTRNARVIIVDTAVGGQSADVIVNTAAPYWNTVDSRVAASGLDPDQVQVVWLKQADGAVPTFSFPAHADTLETHLRGIVTHLKDRFPMLQLCFVSSRIYGGYTTNPARGEPLSYETAFAFRNLIEAQINGDATLNADPGQGPVEAPVILWGAYLWANGTVARASDGLTWQAADLEADNVHPSPSGEAKAAALLSDFFASDATATPWYAAVAGVDLLPIAASKDATVDDAQPATNFGALTDLTWAHPGKRSYVQFDLSSVVDSVVYAKLSLKVLPDDVTGPSDVLAVNNTAWSELAITSSNAPALGALLGTIPNASRGTAVSLDVTAAVQAALAAAPGAAQLALGIRARVGAAADQRVWSRESGEGPRLVLTTIPRATAVGDAPAAARALRVTVAPNPAPGATRIAVTGARAGERVSLAIVDVRGSRVRTLPDAVAHDGGCEFLWDGRDERGAATASGVYFARARGAAGTATHKFVVVR